MKLESTYIGVVSEVSLRSERKRKRKECSKRSSQPTYSHCAGHLVNITQNVIVAKRNSHHALSTPIPFLPCRLHIPRRSSALQHMELMLWQERVRVLCLYRTPGTTCLAASVALPDPGFNLANRGTNPQAQRSKTGFLRVVRVCERHRRR